MMTSEWSVLTQTHTVVDSMRVNILKKSCSTVTLNPGIFDSIVVGDYLGGV